MHYIDISGSADRVFFLLHGDALIEAAGEQRIKDLLFSNTQNAVDRGAFGVPTFFIDDELFFGKEAFNEMPDYL